MPEGYDPNAKVESTIASPNQTPTNNSLNTDPNLVPNTGGIPTQNMQQQPTQVTQMQTSAPAMGKGNVNVASGLNPAHGQPGHRCDIPEGSPLSSIPAATANAPQTITSTPSPAPKTVTAVGMNPPHGEPGHRCDISVGAPLSSAAPEVKQPIAPMKDVNNSTNQIAPAKSGQ